ncbi:MAG: hypothetical protein OER12_00650, partial [Acidimicrobiia bacterium]|nr:hypothetical protein [Acidimicrobiia bacterium]
DGGEGDDVSMIEADREVLIFMDEFEFDPDSIQVERGETVRFTVINAGELPHEFRFTTEHAALEHVALDDPGHHPDAGDLVLALDPGAAGMLVVAFDDDAAFDTLACFLDDHYQQGLSAPLMITP